MSAPPLPFHTSKPKMRNLTLSHHPAYTRAQLARYFKRISLPPAELSSPIPTTLDASSASPTEALRFLTILQRRNLASIPFENLELHYSLHKTINLDPEHLFHKIVDRNAGRGGYCMENSCLFGTVLRSLGYTVYAVAARVNEAIQPRSAGKSWAGPRYDGWNHMLNIVTIGPKRYYVDVGFGSAGPTKPLELVSGQVHRNVGTQSMRLVHGPVEQNTDRGQMLWQYEHRNNDLAAWIPTYCFTETEFFQEDFRMMNYWASTNRASWFTYKVVCVKMIIDEDSGEIIGDTTLLQRDVKRRINSESEVLRYCDSEEDRIVALWQHFGITLTEQECAGIKGMTTDLF